MISAGILAFGLLLLYLGAEWLVKGAAGLARLLGIRPFIIGLTLVAYGTSMPEVIVSSLAAVQGRSAIAVGNVIGSNIANIGLILGITALIAPISVHGRLIHREIPVLLATAIAAPLVLLGGGVRRWEAALLLAGAVVFTAVVIKQGADENDDAVALVEADAEVGGAPPGTGKLRLSLIAFVGLALLLAGGRAFVDGASGFAHLFGISERIIGLTVVAAGTSAPELAASLVAAVRGHGSIAVGNVIGSNIFNVLFVLGGAGLIHPIESNLAEMWVDIPVLLAYTGVCAFLVHQERVITRREGAFLLAGYIAFVAVTIVRG